MSRFVQFSLAAAMVSVAIPASRAEEPKLDANFLKEKMLQLFRKADKDQDGSLSITEFRGLPLLSQVKKDKVDSVFADVDGDHSGGLSSDELGKGFGKITELLKENRATLDDDKSAKKLRRLIRK